MRLSDWATVIIAVATSIYTLGTFLLWRESVNTGKAVAANLKLTFIVAYFQAKRDEVIRQAEQKGDPKAFISDRHRWLSMKEKDYLLKALPELASFVGEMEQQTRPTSSGG